MLAQLACVCLAAAVPRKCGEWAGEAGQRGGRRERASVRERGQ